MSIFLQGVRQMQETLQKYTGKYVSYASNYKVLKIPKTSVPCCKILELNMPLERFNHNKEGQGWAEYLRYLNIIEHISTN